MKRRVLLFALLSVCLATAADAQTTLSYTHGAPGDRLGAAMLPIVDVDGDGYDEILAGAPDPNSGTPGSIWCLSGKYLATGVGTNPLWTLTPSINGAHFGASLAEVATLTGDGATDFVVGAPNYVPSGTNVVTGALLLVDGSTHTVAATIYGEAGTHLGCALVAIGDQDGDGKIDLAAGALDDLAGDASWVHVIPGSAFNGTKALASVPHSSLNTNGDHSFGTALASGFDYDGDSRPELVIGAPGLFGGSGLMTIVKPDNFFSFGSVSGPTAGERLGASLAARHDYDGDGVVDIVVGAPNWSAGAFGTEDGRVYVLNGADFAQVQAPSLLFTFTNPSGPLPSTAHFGAAVCASEDLNGDGIGEVLVGAPDFKVSFPAGQPVRGAIAIFSGASGVKIGGFAGNPGERLGDALVGGFDHLDGDAFLDFAVAASSADSPYLDCGQVRSMRLFPTAAFAYCTAKTNSLGCAPAMSANGSASASSASPFLLGCANVINQKAGFLLYAHSPAATVFQGGFLCLEPPTLRTASQNSGGSTSGADCSGSYSFDFNARIQSGVDLSLVPGAEIFTQFWSRDPQSVGGTSLSNAIRFLINP